MNIFLICPVREAGDSGDSEAIACYVAKLESEGHKVHWPKRDTDQVDAIGYRICTDNYIAIREADEIHIWWSSTSKGSLFDLGMAFALFKKLVLANEVIPTESKSFQNMIRHWSANAHQPL